MPRHGIDQTKLLRSVVRIHAYGRPRDVSKPFLRTDRTKGVGTGSFVTPPRSSPHLFVLTAAHVVAGADTVTVMFPLSGMDEYRAHVVSFVPAYDLALLAVPHDSLQQQAFHLPLGSSETLQLGQKLTAVGYPLGQTALKVSDGVYAGFQGGRLQHTVSISPGNSGGPLLNEHGVLVGVNNSGVVGPAASNIGFAVPVEMYTLMKSRLFGDMSPEWLDGVPRPQRVLFLPEFGFDIAPIARSHAEAVGATRCIGAGTGGVQVTSVMPGSPAASVLARGDILLSFNNHPVSTTGEVSVPWNYQKVQLQDMLTRCIDDTATYPLTAWRAVDRQCVTTHMTPRAFLVHGLKPLFPPYDPLPSVTVLGLVIMPLCANHRLTPVTQRIFFRLQPEQLTTPRLVVSHVFNGSMAQMEGPLQAGDEITHVNGRPVSTLAQLESALPQFQRNAAGHPVVSLVDHTGRQFVVNGVDVLTSEERAATEGIYDPFPPLMQALRAPRQNFVGM